MVRNCALWCWSSSQLNYPILFDDVRVVEVLYGTIRRFGYCLSSWLLLCVCVHVWFCYCTIFHRISKLITSNARTNCFRNVSPHSQSGSNKLLHHNSRKWLTVKDIHRISIGLRFRPGTNEYAECVYRNVVGMFCDSFSVNVIPLCCPLALPETVARTTIDKFSELKYNKGTRLQTTHGSLIIDHFQ